jgi:hypothetical protein
MKRNLTVRSAVFTAVFLTMLFCGNPNVVAQTFKLSAVSDMAQVFEDGYKMPKSYDSVKTFGIRGEIVSAQLVVAAKKNLSGVSVEIGELKSKNGNILPASSAEWNFVGYIPITENTPNQPVAHLVRRLLQNFPNT